jgi:hypothetical protein
MAVLNGHAEVAKALLAAGASVYASIDVSEEYRWVTGLIGSKQKLC